MKDEIITPVIRVGNYWLKRDDLYTFAGVCGGKVRTILSIILGCKDPQGIITSTQRDSSQATITARIGAALGLPTIIHMPTGAETKAMQDVIKHKGIIIHHKAGYSSVLAKQAAIDHAKRPGWVLIPPMLACVENITQTRKQVVNIPALTKRIVIPIGSGMSAAGVLHGLNDNKLNIPVLGVRVGSDTTKRLDSYAPFGWRNMMLIVKAHEDYDKGIVANIGKVVLDQHYEAKCVEYMQRCDLLWVVGNRTTMIN